MPRKISKEIKKLSGQIITQNTEITMIPYMM